MPGSSYARGAKRRAVIIGGSMSGLFTAAFLRQIGWDVDVYERSSVELVGRGAGITGHPELLDALEASGAGTKNLGVEVPKRIAIDRNGRVIDERPLRQILTSWDRFSSPLVNQFHERVLPAAAPAWAAGVGPLLSDSRQPRSVANLRSGTFKLGRTRARGAMPVVIVHGISDLCR